MNQRKWYVPDLIEKYKDGYLGFEVDPDKKMLGLVFDAMEMMIPDLKILPEELVHAIADISCLIAEKESEYYYNLNYVCGIVDAVNYLLRTEWFLKSGGKWDIKNRVYLDHLSGAKIKTKRSKRAKMGTIKILPLG